MSGVGFAILAHQRLDRVAALVRHLSAGGNPVAVHVDMRVVPERVAALRRDIGPGPEVLQEHPSEWGQFGLIEATLSLVRRFLEMPDPPGHIYLLSGGCLPLRPVADLEAFLARNQDFDFIESVPVAEDQWVQDGLSLERMTLWHPFSHRHHPRLFSASVDVQRALGIRRRLPPGVAPHLGAQWWCLRTETLRSIVEDPRLLDWKRFFRQSWIPDESFFQCLVRTVRPDQKPAPALHLNRFNTRGRPSVFHDDHLELLKASDYFFARKIDPDAAGLYDYFLAERAGHPVSETFSGRIDETAFLAARERLASEGQGVLGQSRMPLGNRLTFTQTEAPYLVLIGDMNGLLQDLWMKLAASVDGLVCHGRLMARGMRAEFANDAKYLRGNLSCDPALRDYRASQFLARVLLAGRPHRTAFLLGPGDDALIRVQLCNDPNARLVVLDTGQQVAQKIANLREPLPPNKPVPWWRLRRRRGRPSALNAWYRGFDPAALSADLAGSGDGVTLDGLLELAGSDWSVPDGWTVPA